MDLNPVNSAHELNQGNEPKVINYYKKLHQDRDAFNEANNIKPDVPMHKTIEL